MLAYYLVTRDFFEGKYILNVCTSSYRAQHNIHKYAKNP